MRGRWAAGIVPRNFAWILKDQLAVSERPGGYAPHHRRVRRQEEILWLRAQGFSRIVSLLPSSHNLHAYDELDMASSHFALPVHGDARATLAACYPALLGWIRDGERILLHHEELGERAAGVAAGFICWSGLLPDPPQAISAIEQLLKRQLGSIGRSLVALADEIAVPVTDRPFPSAMASRPGPQAMTSTPASPKSPVSERHRGARSARSTSVGGQRELDGASAHDAAYSSSSSMEQTSLPTTERSDVPDPHGDTAARPGTRPHAEPPAALGLGARSHLGPGEAEVPAGSNAEPGLPAAPATSWPSRASTSRKPSRASRDREHDGEAGAHSRYVVSDVDPAGPKTSASAQSRGAARDKASASGAGTGRRAPRPRAKPSPAPEKDGGGAPAAPLEREQRIDAGAGGPDGPAFEPLVPDLAPTERGSAGPA